MIQYSHRSETRPGEVPPRRKGVFAHCGALKNNQVRHFPVFVLGGGPLTSFWGHLEGQSRPD